MKVLFRHIAVLLCCILLGMGNAYAQKVKSLDDKEKMANKLFEEGKYLEAYPMFSQIRSNKPKDPNVNYKYGACLMYSDSDKSKALSYLNFACRSSSVDPEAYFFLGKLHHLNYRFEAAIAQYKKYQQKSKSDAFDVAREIEMCNNGLSLLKEIKDLVVLDKREIEIDKFFRLYASDALGGQVLVTDDFQSKEDKKRGHRAVIHFPANSEYILISSYSDKTDHKDIFIVRKLPGSKWSSPQEIQGPLNTPYDEDFPYLHPDGKTLYFSSKGHNSMGGYDVFQCEIDPATGKAGPVKNLDFAVNTPDDDIFYIVDGPREQAFFASNRESKQGYVNVYQVRVGRLPVRIAVIKGSFHSEISPSNLKAEITVKDPNTDEVVGVFNTNPSDGSYNITLPKGGIYHFIVKSDNSGIKHLGEVNIPFTEKFRPLKQELHMVQVEADEQLRIDNLFEDEIGDDGIYLDPNFLLAKSKLDVNVNDVDQSELGQGDEAEGSAPVSSLNLNRLEKNLTEAIEQDAAELALLKKNLNAAYHEVNERNKAAANLAQQANQVLNSGSASGEQLAQANEDNKRAKLYATEAQALKKLIEDLEPQIEEREERLAVFNENLQAIKAIPEDERESKAGDFESVHDILGQNQTALLPTIAVLEDFNRAALAAQKKADNELLEAQEMREETAQVENRLKNNKTAMAQAKKQKDKDAYQIEIDRLEEEKEILIEETELSFKKAQKLQEQAILEYAQVGVLAELFTKDTTYALLGDAERTAAMQQANDFQGLEEQLASNDKSIRGHSLDPEVGKNPYADLQDDPNFISKTKQNLEEDIAEETTSTDDDTPLDEDFAEETTSTDDDTPLDEDFAEETTSTDDDTPLDEDFAEETTSTDDDTPLDEDFAEETTSTDDDTPLDEDFAEETTSTDDDALIDEDFAEETTSTDDDTPLDEDFAEETTSTDDDTPLDEDFAEETTSTADDATFDEDEPLQDALDPSYTFDEGVYTEQADDIDFTSDENADESYKALVETEALSISPIHSATQKEHTDEFIARVQERKAEHEAWLNIVDADIEDIDAQIGATDDEQIKAQLLRSRDEMETLKEKRNQEISALTAEEFKASKALTQYEQIRELSPDYFEQMELIRNSSKSVSEKMEEEANLTEEVRLSAQRNLGDQDELKAYYEQEDLIKKLQTKEEVLREKQRSMQFQQDVLVISQEQISTEKDKLEVEDAQKEMKQISVLVKKLDQRRKDLEFMLKKQQKASPKKQERYQAEIDALEADILEKENEILLAQTVVYQVEQKEVKQGLRDRVTIVKSTSLPDNDPNLERVETLLNRVDQDLFQALQLREEAAKVKDEEKKQELLQSALIQQKQGLARLADLNALLAELERTDYASPAIVENRLKEGRTDLVADNTTVSSEAEALGEVKSAAELEEDRAEIASFEGELEGLNKKEREEKYEELNTMRTALVQDEIKTELADEIRSITDEVKTTPGGESIETSTALEERVKADVLTQKAAELKLAMVETQQATEVETDRTRLEILNQRLAFLQVQYDAAQSDAQAATAKAESEQEGINRQALVYTVSDNKRTTVDVGTLEVNEVVDVGTSSDMETFFALVQDGSRERAAVQNELELYEGKVREAGEARKQAEEFTQLGNEAATVEEQKEFIRMASVQYQKARDKEVEAEQSRIQLVVAQDRVKALEDQMDSFLAQMDPTDKDRLLAVSQHMDYSKSFSENKNELAEKQETLLAGLRTGPDGNVISSEEIDRIPADEVAVDDEVEDIPVADLPADDVVDDSFEEDNNVVESAPGDFYPAVVTDQIFTVANDVDEQQRSIPIDPEMPQGIVFKVQVGAFRNPIPRDLFKEFVPISGEQRGGGLTRYTAGLFNALGPANRAKDQIRGLGYSDAFVVAYNNGERISVREAQRLLSEGGVVANNVTTENNASQENTAAETSTAQEDFTSEGDFTENTTADDENSNRVNSSYEPQDEPLDEDELSNDALSFFENGGEGDNLPDADAGTSTTAGGANNTAVNQSTVNAATGSDGYARATDVSTISELYYTVQIGFFKTKVSPAELLYIQPLNVQETAAGVRYSTGRFNSVEAASARRGEIQQRGISDAFVTAYYNGERVSIAEALTISSDSGDQTGSVDESSSETVTVETEVPETTEEVEGLWFKVFLGQYEDEVPVSEAVVYLKLVDEGIQQKVLENGETVYHIGNYKKYEEAENFVKEIREEGLRSAKVIATFFEEEITLEEAFEKMNP